MLPWGEERGGGERIGQVEGMGEAERDLECDLPRLPPNSGVEGSSKVGSSSS